MTRTGQAAIDYARGRVGGSMPASGYCLQFTRECFDVGALYGSAIDAWNGAIQHPGDRNPPLAVPLYFRTPSVYDHVVFGVSSGECISTFNADIRSFPGIGSIEANFDGTYLGWAEDINGVRVWSPAGPTPAPEPPPEEEDKMIGFARLDGNPQVWVGDGITRRPVRSEHELADLTYKIQTGFFKGTTDVQVVAAIDWLGEPVE